MSSRKNENKATREPVGGTLYLVATPIGNLEDITLRAIRLLRQVRLIAAEDTRRTHALLSAHGISNRMISYREQNHRKAAEQILQVLSDGGAVACVSDAGTPGLSDPGQRLVGLVLDAGYEVVSVPGASAPVTALVASGLESEPFLFAGFFPRRQSDRKRLLDMVEDLPATLVFFESPERLPATLRLLAQRWPNRKAVVAKELTKVHERFMRGTLGNLAQNIRQVRGEVVLLVEGKKDEDTSFGELERYRALANALLDAKSPSLSTVASLLAGLSGAKRGYVYKWLLSLKGSSEDG